MAIDYDVVNGKNKKKIQDTEQVLAHDPALTGMRPVQDPLAQSQTYLAGAQGETAKPTVAQQTAALKGGNKTVDTTPVAPADNGGGGNGGGGNGGGWDPTAYLNGYPTYNSPTAGASYTYSGALPTYSFTQAAPTWSYNQATPGEFTYDATRPADFSYDVARPADFTYDRERPADFAYDAVKPEYSSAYQDQINAMVDQILNRPQFTYDYTTDPLYQQYAEAYTRNGKQAMSDTHAQLAARTGGLASSYAGTAAQQQYNQYMQALNDKIPELYQLAYSMYNDEGNTMRNNLGMIQGLESTDYGRYMDQLGQYNTDRNFAYNVWQGQQNAYDTDRNFAYNQWLANQDQYENDRNLAYNQWLANQEQYENDRNFAYNQYNDAWDRYYNDRNFSYGQYQDQLGQYNTDRNFAYNQYIDALGQYNTDRNFDYGLWSDNLSRQEAAAKAAYNAKVAAYNSAYGNKSGSSGSETTESYFNDPFNALQSAGIQTYGQALAYLNQAGFSNAKEIAQNYIDLIQQGSLSDPGGGWGYVGLPEVSTNKNGYVFNNKTYKDLDSLADAITAADLSSGQWNQVMQSMLRNHVIGDEEYDLFENMRKK